MSYPTAIAMVMSLPCLCTLTSARREERATPRELAGIVVHAIGALLSTAHSVYKEDGMDAVHEQLIREVRVAAYYDRCSPSTMTAADIGSNCPCVGGHGADYVCSAPSSGARAARG
jgi:hypothetical protein